MVRCVLTAAGGTCDWCDCVVAHLWQSLCSALWHPMLLVLLSCAVYLHTAPRLCSPSLVIAAIVPGLLVGDRCCSVLKGTSPAEQLCSWTDYDMFVHALFLMELQMCLPTVRRRLCWELLAHQHLTWPTGPGFKSVDVAAGAGKAGSQLYTSNILNNTESSDQTCKSRTADALSRSQAQPVVSWCQPV